MTAKISGTKSYDSRFQVDNIEIKIAADLISLIDDVPAL
jgi:hypothetical protein